MTDREHRELTFDTLDAGMTEARRLAEIPTRTTGNYGHGQLIDHLARAMEIATGDLAPPPVPAVVRWVGPLLRGFMTKRRMKPGFNVPEKVNEHFWSANDVPLSDAMQRLETAYERFRTTDTLPPHPILGHYRSDQAEALQCRHFELHLGFIVPR